MGLIEELKKKRDQAVALARKVPASPVSTAIGVARKALPNTSFNNPGSVVMGVAKRYAPTAVRDVADSNTQRDQQKRAQATVTPYRIPTSYEDEQKMKGNNRPFTNLGQQVVGNTARVVNTAVQQNLRTVPQAMAGVTLKVANRTGLLNNRDYNNAVNNVLSDKKVYGGYTDKGGVLNAGTVVDSPEQAKNLTTRDVVQKSVGYGMGTYGELSPIGAKGGFAGRTLLGATEGAIGDAGSQLVNTGRIDPRQTLGSALFGGTLSNAGPVASKLLGRNTPTPRTPDPRLNDADVSGLLKIKNGRGDFMDDVEYTKALESVRKAGIDITKPEAWSQIDGVLARYNQVLEGRGDPSMFNMGQSRFKPTPLNQGGYIKNPLATDSGYRSSHQIDTTTAKNLGAINTIDDVVAQVKSKYGLTNYDQKDIANLKKIIGNPDADVKIYRTSPVNEINSGDWVTTSKTYADDIKRQNGGKVYEYTVKAKDLNLPANIEDNPSLARFSAFQYNQAPKNKLGLTPLNQGGYVKNPLAKDPLESLKQEADTGKVFYHGTSNKDLKSLTDLQAGSGVGKSGRNRVYVTENPEIAKNFGDNVIEQRLYGKHLNVKDIGVEKTPGWAQDNVVAPEFADYKTTKLLTERERRVFENQFVRGVPNNTIIEDTPGIHKYLASKGYTTITVPRTISDVDGVRSETIIIDKKAFQAPVQSQPPKSTPVQKVDPLESLKQEARKYKSAEEFIDTDKTISVPIRDFPKTDTTSWNEALNNVSKGELSKTAGPVEVVLTPNGYKLVEGNHRAVQALQSGKDSIEAKIISKEGLEKIAQRDGPHIKMNMQDSLTRQQLTDLYNQATQPPKSTLANDAPQVSDLVKQRRQLIEDMDASSQALTNATATQRGAMGIVPKQIMDSPEIKALQQDFYTKKSQLEQFNRLNKTNKDLQTAIKDELIAKRTQRSQKLTRQVGETDKPFVVTSETRPSNPNAPVMQKGITVENGKMKLAERVKETRTNTTGIKNYNPDGLPTPANKVVQDLAGFYESLGSSQGVDIVDGRRVSNNSPAYRELYAELGRKPTSKDWYDYAYNQINNGTAPREITDQFEKTLNFELSTDKTIQAPEALNPQGSIPIKNKPSDMPTSDWESLIRSRVPDQTKVDVVNNGGKLEIQKKTIAPITKQETVQQTIPTEVAPEVKVKPDKDFTVSTNQYLGTLESAETTARSLADTLPAKLKGQDAIDAIVAKDNGIRTGRPEIDSVNDQVDRIYNNLYAKYKDAGFDMGYVDNYSPRIYKHPKTGEAITKADYLFLTRTPGQTISRTAQNVNPDDLLYKTPQELLAHYTRTFERAKAGREYFDALKKSGHIVESGTRPDGMMVIDAPGMPQPSPRDFDGAQIQGNYYAYPEVAKKINKVFGVDEGNKISNVTAKVAGKLQDIGLSGGVPFTPLNSFTFAQVTKELTAGKVSAPLKALFGSLSDKQAQKFFKNNAPIVEEMQKQGIRISSEYNTSTLNGFMDSLKGKKGSEKAGMLWDRTMSDPTFKRFMPRLQVETYKQVKGKLLNKYPDAEASKLAGDLVKNFYGLTDLTTQATRSQTGSDIVSTVFFAPKYRESMGRFWLNNVKALDPRKINDPAYAQNIRFNIGATLLFGAMQGANMYLNGTPTWENPEGKKDKLIIPDKYVPFNTNGKDLGVPFLSSIATVPRNIATGLAGAVTGNFGEVGKSAKSFLGYGVRPLADLANNEDYFGSQIYKEDGSTGEKLGSGASYLTKAFMPPYIREGINAASNKLPEGVKDFVGARDQSGFETLARVGETPLRFYDPNYYRGEGDKFGTGGMTKAMADSEAGKKKTAKELEMEEKKLKQSYEKSFSKEDLKFLSKDSAERQKLIDNGIKTKEELDGLDRYALNKRKELGMPAGQLGAKEVPEKIDGTDDKVKSFYTDRSYIHQDDYEAWQTSAPESDSAKDMIRRVNQMRPEGAPELPANNRTAELYADYKKEQANSKWSKLQETEKKKELLRTVYKTQLTDDQKFVDELGTDKLIYAIDNGQVDPNIMKSMVELDNALIKLGGTAMLSKTVRNRYGLGSAPSSGGSGSGKAKKPVGLGSFTLLPQKSSIGSVANLLKNARVSYKS